MTSAPWSGMVTPEQVIHYLTDRRGSGCPERLEREGNADAVVRAFPDGSR